MKRFEGRNILITGISGGIGLHVAKRFLDEGARVLGSYRKMKPELEDLKASLSDEKLKLFELDTNNRDLIGTTVKAQIKDFGGIDVLVNCIGITHPEPLFAANAQNWEMVIENNLFTAMRITQAVIVPLISRKHGVILNISSVFGSIGGVGQSSYCASKAALDGMTRAVARELAVKKIRVNTVAPGFIETEMTAGFDEKFKAESIEKVPLKRFGNPEEVAALCAFLASDEAQYITGQTLLLTAGFHADGIMAGMHVVKS